MYTWQYNKVFEVVMVLLRAQYEAANQQPVTAKESIIQFHKEGECPVREQKTSIMKLLNGASDWKVSVDLKTSLLFPVLIIQTEKLPDIIYIYIYIYIYIGIFFFTTSIFLVGWLVGWV